MSLVLYFPVSRGKGLVFRCCVFHFNNNTQNKITRQRVMANFKIYVFVPRKLLGIKVSV